jgi:hypothetical protein
MVINSRKKFALKLTLFLSLFFIFTPIQVHVLPEANDIFSFAVSANQQKQEATSQADTPGTNVLKSKEGGCSASPTSWGQCVVNAIGGAMINFAAFFTWSAGGALDLSIKWTVEKFGELMGGGLGITVNELWTLIRDVCNLAFVFGFIYLGIRTIFDPESAQVKRYLSRIIIGALLINFSLFFAKVIIDFSNMAGVQIYNAILTSNSSNPDATFSQIAFQSLGLVTIYGNEGITDALNEFMVGDKSFVFYLMASLFLLITAFVFLVAAILLAIRFVHLIFLMIASPVLFAAIVFPQTEKYSSDLWKKLINYSIFLPAYLLMIFISFKAIKNLGMGEDGSFSKALLSGENTLVSGNMDIVIKFIIIIFFMISSLSIAQKVGVYGADAAVKIGNNIRRGAQGYVGRGAVRAARLDKLAEKQDEMRKSDSKLARTGAFALRATGIDSVARSAKTAKFGSDESTVDVDKRNKEINRARAQDKQTRLANSSITSVAQSLEGGQTPNTSQTIAMERAVATSSNEQLLSLLKTHKGTPEYNMVVGNMTSSQFDNLMKAKPEDVDDTEKANLRKVRAEAINKKLVDVENAKRVAAGNTPDAKISDVIGKASGSDLEALNFENDVLANAGKLSNKQIDDMKGLTPTEKTALKAKRKEDIIAEANAGGHDDIFKRFKGAEAAKLPKEVLMGDGALKYLTPDILTKAIDNDDFTDNERSELKQKLLTKYSPNAGPQTPADKEKYRAFERFFRSPAGNNYA